MRRSRTGWPGLLLVHQAKLALKDLRVPKDRKGPKVLRVRSVLKDHKDLLARQVRRDPGRHRRHWAGRRHWPARSAGASGYHGTIGNHRDTRLRSVRVRWANHRCDSTCDHKLAWQLCCRCV